MYGKHIAHLSRSVSLTDAQFAHTLTYALIHTSEVTTTALFVKKMNFKFHYN